MVEQNNDERDQEISGEQPQAANDAGPEVAAEDSRLAEAERQAAELKDRLLRALAEIENVRRRAEREAEDMRKYAVSDFARELLGVADNLQRALAGVKPEAREGNPELAAFLAGVELTERELSKALEKHGVTPIEALGRKLDPNLHQAVAQIDDPQAQAGEIVQVFQTGYMIADRLLRPAMVAVAKGRAADSAGERVDTHA